MTKPSMTKSWEETGNRKEVKETVGNGCVEEQVKGDLAEREAWVVTGKAGY